MANNRNPGFDKENDVVGVAANSALIPAVAKSGSTIGIQTPRSHGHAPQKANLMQRQPSTPTHHILRSKINLQTNIQQVQRRQYQEKSNEKGATKSTGTVKPSTEDAATALEAEAVDPLNNRRKSMTRRGLAKTPPAMKIYKDVAPGAALKPTRMKETLTPGKAHASTTMMASDRATTTGQLKVGVRPGTTDTKRQAVANELEPEGTEVEYCPPPVAEPPFDPGYDMPDFGALISRLPLPAAAYDTFKHQEELNSDENDTRLLFQEVQTHRSPSPFPERSPSPTVDVSISGFKTDNGSFQVMGLKEDGPDEFFGIQNFHDSSRVRPLFDDFLFDSDEPLPSSPASSFANIASTGLGNSNTSRLATSLPSQSVKGPGLSRTDSSASLGSIEGGVSKGRKRKSPSPEFKEKEKEKGIVVDKDDKDQEDRFSDIASPGFLNFSVDL